VTEIAREERELPLGPIRRTKYRQRTEWQKKEGEKKQDPAQHGTNDARKRRPKGTPILSFRPAPTATRSARQSALNLKRLA
jgi:hypothetical protein